MQGNVAYKRYCRFCWWGGRCLRFAARGTFSSAANWSGILGSALLAFLLQRYGRSLMPPGSYVEILAQGLLYVALAWGFIFVLRLAISPFFVFRDGE